jgi:hypothetical protein
MEVSRDREPIDWDAAWEALSCGSSDPATNGSPSPRLRWR